MNGPRAGPCLLTVPPTLVLTPSKALAEPFTHQNSGPTSANRYDKRHEREIARPTRKPSARINAEPPAPARATNAAGMRYIPEVYGEGSGLRPLLHPIDSTLRTGGLAGIS